MVTEIQHDQGDNIFSVKKDHPDASQKHNKIDEKDQRTFLKKVFIDST